MKRILLISLCSILLLMGCSNSETSNIPKGMHPDTYNYGTNALSIMEKYNDAEINKHEADSRLDSLYNSLENIEFDGEYKQHNLEIKIDISRFQSAMFGISDDSTYSIADELREHLGLK